MWVYTHPLYGTSSRPLPATNLCTFKSGACGTGAGKQPLAIAQYDFCVGAHIYQHLWDYVERHPVWKDGVVGHTTWDGWRPLEAKQGQGWNEFYVDKHGILQRSPTPKKREKKADPNVRKISDLEFYIRREDGVWFFLRMEPQLWSERPSCIDPARMDRYLTNPGQARIPDGLSFTVPHRLSLMEVRTASKKEKKEKKL